MSISEIMEKLRTRGREGAASAIKPLQGGVSIPRLKLPSRKVVYTGLDIGTTKICAIIGEIDPSGKMTVLGLASTPSHGLRRGVVINLDETVESIRVAVRKAEDIAQVTVKDVFVGIAGGHIQCHQLHAEVDVTNPERGITAADVRRVLHTATEGQIPVEREVLHQIAQQYTLDDSVVVEPLGFSSRKLGADVLLVTAAVTSAQNIIRAVANARYHVAGIYLEPLASSLAILTEEMKEQGVILIDIGGGTSDIAVFVDGAVRYTGVVNLGGDSVSDDISKGLAVTRYEAENLKKRHGTCLPASVDPMEIIQAAGIAEEPGTSHKRQFLAEIIEARLEEILLMIRAKVEKLPFYGQTYGGIVFTGGGSLMPGLADLGQRVFRKPCRLGNPSGLSGFSSVASSPIYSTGVGLVMYGLEHERERAYFDSNAFTRLMKTFGRFVDWYG
jgi:cell division protein FtsA